MNRRMSWPTCAVVVAAVATLPLDASAVSAKKKQAAGPTLVVVDGAGRKLGPVVHVEDPLFDAQGVYRRAGAPIAVDAAFQRDSRVYLLRFLTVEPYLDGTSRVFFESCDCSGTPLIRAEPTGQFGSLFTPSAIAASHKLYLATESAETATRKTVCSLVTADTGCEPVGDSDESADQAVVPAELVGQLPFQEPYHVEGSGLSDPLAAR